MINKFSLGQSIESKQIPAKEVAGAKLEKQEKFAEGLYVSWEVMPVCDLACPHCYALNEEQEHDFKERKTSLGMPGMSYNKLPIQDIEKGLSNLESVGARFFNIEGGEPTLRPDIIEIAELAKSKGMKVVISTHGMYLMKSVGNTPHLAEKLCGKISTLSLSLDAETAEFNDVIRVKASGKPSNHFEKVMEFLKWYGDQTGKEKNSTQPLYELKINTVVMKSNMDAVGNIGELIRNSIPSEVNVQWKIIQFHPRGKGRLAKEELGIPEEKFETVVQKIQQRYGNELNISVRRYSEDMYPFVIIGFNGEAVIPIGEKQDSVKVAGEPLNVLEDSFYTSLKSYVNNNPKFLEENKKINNYL